MEVKNKMILYIRMALSSFYFLSLQSKLFFAQRVKETYRTQFHYRAPSVWVGDPCGLISYQVYNNF